MKWFLCCTQRSFFKVFSLLKKLFEFPSILSQSFSIERKLKVYFALKGEASKKFTCFASNFHIILAWTFCVTSCGVPMNERLCGLSIQKGIREEQNFCKIIYKVVDWDYFEAIKNETILMSFKLKTVPDLNKCVLLLLMMIEKVRCGNFCTRILATFGKIGRQFFNKLVCHKAVQIIIVKPNFRRFLQLSKLILMQKVFCALWTKKFGFTWHLII